MLFLSGLMGKEVHNNPIRQRYFPLAFFALTAVVQSVVKKPGIPFLNHRNILCRMADKGQSIRIFVERVNILVQSLALPSARLDKV